MSRRVSLTIAFGVMAAVLATSAFADISITPDNNATTLANALLAGTGVTVTGATLDGRDNGPTVLSSGLYTLTGPLPDTYGMTLDGVVLSTGDVSEYETGDSAPVGSTDYSVPATPAQEALLNPITGAFFHQDVTQLDVTFDAGMTDTVIFEVVFGSEDTIPAIPDGFGLLLNGVNLAIVNAAPVNATHPDMVFADLLFPPPTGTQLDYVMAPGDVAVLTFFGSVTPGSTGNTLTLILGDALDEFGDSTTYIAPVPAPPCIGGTSLTANLWKQVSVPCDLGAANTVDDVFADDLGGGLGATWWVYQYNEASSSYQPLLGTDPLVAGEGYWLRSSFSSAVDVSSPAPNGSIDIPLTAQRFNMVGHPFTFPVCWADVQVVYGANVLTLAEADPEVSPGVHACDVSPTPPECVMWRVGNRWSGSSYEPFDGQTPLMEGQLHPFDGLWVWPGQTGVSLRIPNVPGPLTCGGPLEGPGWLMRLSASSGRLSDSTAVIAQMPGSLDGFDSRDLPEMEPFTSPFLTVVFPHQDWPRPYAGDYATDFRSLGSTTPVRFEVRTSQIGRPVELTWEAPADVLLKRALVDEETGRVIPMDRAGSYSFDMKDSGTRSFLVRVRRSGRN